MPLESQLPPRAAGAHTAVNYASIQTQDCGGCGTTVANEGELVLWDKDNAEIFRANFPRIVHCVNHHASLVSALEFLLALDINELIDREVLSELNADRADREQYLAGELAKARTALASARQT